MDINDLKNLSQEERFELYSAPKRRQQKIEKAIQANLPKQTTLERDIAHYERMILDRKRHGKSTDMYEDKVAELKAQMRQQEAIKEWKSSTDYSSTKSVFEESLAKIKDRGADDRQIENLLVQFGVYERQGCDDVALFEETSKVLNALDNRDRQKQTELRQESARLQRDAENINLEVLQIEGQISEGASDESN